MEITFLGTSSMVPTSDRNHNAIFISHTGNGLLFDCGEGTQRQLRIASIRPTRISAIFISHWHGDHVLGLAGLIQTIGAASYTGLLRIFGPPGSIEHFEHMMRASIFQEKVEIEVKEIVEGDIFETETLKVHAIPLTHSVPCIGYSVTERDRRRILPEKLEKLGIPPGPHLRTLQEGKDLTWDGKVHPLNDLTTFVRGKKVSIIMDTRMCENAIELSKESDLIISEATFIEENSDKAAAFKHLTASDAARIAKEAAAKRLILTHFSQRYSDVRPLLIEAQTVFPETSCAHDFLHITL